MSIMYWLKSPWYRLRHRYRIGMVEECVDYEDRGCRGKNDGLGHHPCHDCGGLTCGNRNLRIDPVSRQRQLKYVCMKCKLHGSFRSAHRQQQTLANQRTKDDWSEEQLPDQYPGGSRATLRSFVVEDDAASAATEVAAGVLNSSINTLGLENEVYAETRSRGSFLRRIKGSMTPGP